MEITRKKKELRYRERNREERIKYYQTLRELIKIYGGKSLVLIDESGVEEFQDCLYAWSKKGRKSWEIDKENEEKERTLSLGEERGKKT
jgi:hypothetical protein